MSNERDSGRYDQFTNTTSGTNVRVDFVWGNLPMQPNDDRGEGQDLDPALDGHIIATSRYEGFPAFIQGAPYDDTVDNVEVPNIVGQDGSTAAGILAGANLNSSSDTTTDGANSENNGKVKSQSPDAGTIVNINSTVSYVTYYNPQVAVPNLLGMNLIQVGDALTSVGLVGSNTLSTDGATSGNNGTVKSQAIAAGTMVDPGTTINYVLYNYVAPNMNIAGIRAVSGNIHQRYLYLNGRNSGLAYLDQITLHNTGVANYNRPFNVMAVVNDDAFNTGGQKVTIQNGLMDGTGGDVTNTGTYTKP